MFAGGSPPASGSVSMAPLPEEGRFPRRGIQTARQEVLVVRESHDGKAGNGGEKEEVRRREKFFHAGSTKEHIKH